MHEHARRNEDELDRVTEYEFDDTNGRLEAVEAPLGNRVELSCTRFDGHREQVFMEPGGADDQGRRQAAGL